MSANFRFAIASDLHIALPETIPDRSQRFHLVEVSIPALETVLADLATLELDFLLLPGDLTQDGEPENHAWLQERLEQLPYPAYVIPGNHDIPSATGSEQEIAPDTFPAYYRHCGYSGDRLYYTCELLPGVRLVALNSNDFDAEGKQHGRLDAEQLDWLRAILPELRDSHVLLTVHHNVIEHVPGQARHPLSRRYMLDNAAELKAIMRDNGVKIVFTGHLHVQDIASEDGLYDVVTGSLVSYPHPYRIIEASTDANGQLALDIDSRRVRSVPGWEHLQEQSREYLGARSAPFMNRLLDGAPVQFDLDEEMRDRLAKRLRYFWADLAAGDAEFDFSEFPPPIRRYLKSFNATAQPTYLGDNRARLVLA